MQALRFHEFGPIENLRVETVPDPQPGPGEVVVKVRASALNPSDPKNVLGRMEGTTLPRTPGRDFAGVVTQGPTSMLGLEVWGTGGEIGFTRDGAHAEAIVVPATGVRPKPARLSFEEAASVGVAFLAAWIGMVEAAQVRAGDTVLVTGATGGVGGAAGQIARHRGARIIGADRVPLPPERASEWDEFIHVDPAGADAEPLVAAVHRLTQGGGASLCFDTVGGPMFEPCLRCLGQRGRQVAITSVGDRRVCFDLLDFYHRRLTLVGVDTRAYDSTASAAILEQLAEGFDAGDFRAAPIARRFALEQAVEAYSAINAGAIQGKAVFTFNS